MEFTYKHFIAFKSFLTICLLSVIAAAYGQQSVISGKVIDEDDEEPLPFATIGVEGTTRGVISNTIGEFDLHYDQSTGSESMVIQMLGYEDYRVPISSLGQGVNIFRLKKMAIQLKEVIIVDSLTGGEIMQIALERIEYNYPSTPYNMEGFYRDLKKVDDQYVSLLEAAFNIYDKDYTEPRNPSKLRERVGLVEVRKSLNYEAQFREYFDHYNQLEEMLLQNNIKYRTFPSETIFFENIVRSDIVGMGSRSLYKLEIQGDHDYTLTLFVDSETYGIQRLVYQYGDMVWPLQEISRSGKRTEKVMRIEKEIEFTNYEGKLYLKYMRVITNTHWTIRDSDEKIAETQLEQFLVINNIDTKNPEWITSGKKMKKYGLQFQDLPYNDDFWDSYNLLKDTPLDEQIVKDLEKYGDLNEQFQY
jgi:hypothetical protein